MKLRTYRTFSWGYRGSIGDLRFGGNDQLSLNSHDQLQYQEEPDGEWLDVPVVEAERPEHPKAAKERERQARMAEEIKRIFENSRPVTFDELQKENTKSVMARLRKK